MGVGLLWWLPRLARKWISHADAIFCVSKRHCRILSEALQELRGKLILLYNPAPTDFLKESFDIRKKEEEPVLLYTGGDSYIKGFHLVLRLINTFGRSKTRVKFIFVNSYSVKSINILRNMKSKYSNLDIEVPGRVSRRQLLDIYKRASYFLFPSIWEEPYGNAVIEAVVANLVPVVSNVSGVSEILEGTPLERYIFRFDDFSDFSEKVNLAIKSKDDISIIESSKNIILRKLDYFSAEIPKIFASLAQI